MKCLTISNITKKLLQNTLKIDANSTTCTFIYQPKVPRGLEKYSNINNDLK